MSCKETILRLLAVIVLLVVTMISCLCFNVDPAVILLAIVYEQIIRHEQIKQKEKNHD